jgi:hypothetical protein
MKKNSVLSITVTGALLVAACLGGCAPDKGDKSGKQAAKAQTLIQNATSYLQPTNTAKTAVEGAWVQRGCINGSYRSGAQSYNVGYIFIGNSFYKQVDYYASTNCEYDNTLSLAEGRVYAEVSAGWFSLGAETAGLRTINMLGAPNFGNRYELNVFTISGSGEDAVMMMGESESLSTTRPTTANIPYDRWDTSSFAGNGT